MVRTPPGLEFDMTQVEAANAGSARQTSQSRFTVLDSTPALPTGSGGADQFATLLARTIQSPSWLASVQERWGDQVGPAARRLQQLQGKTETSSSRSRVEALKDTADKARSSAETRVDRFREVADVEARPDRLKAQMEDGADQAELPDPLGSSRGAVDTVEADAVDPSARPDASEVPADGESPESTPAGQGPLEWCTGLTAMPLVGGPGQFLTFTVGAGFPGSAMTPPVGDVAGLPPQPGMADSLGQTASGQGSAAVAGGTRVATLPGTDTSAGGDAQGKASADASSSAASVRAGEGGQKASGTATDFQQMLQQVGRLRGPGGGIQNPASGTLLPAEETVKLNEPQAATELARVVRSAIGTRNSSMVLRLDPPELGQVRVDVRMQDQTLTLRFHTETQEGYDALRARLDDLRQTLEQQGVQLDRVEVELRQTASPGDARQDGSQGQHLPTDSHSGFGDLPGQHGADHGTPAQGQPERGNSYEHDSLPGEQAAEQDLRADGGERLTESGVDLIV